MLEVLSAERLRALLADWQPLRALNLAGGDYRGVDLSNARLEQVDARGAQFNGAMLTQSYWKDCAWTAPIFREHRGLVVHERVFIAGRIVHEMCVGNKTSWAQCHGEDLDLSGAQLQALHSRSAAYRVSGWQPPS